MSESQLSNNFGVLCLRRGRGIRDKAVAVDQTNDP